MIIGLLKEIKADENRVGLTPAGARILVGAGHQVVVEAGAGIGSGFPDSEYLQYGARIDVDKRRIAQEADLIVKVKEPLPEEYELFHPGQLLYTYLHLAPARELTEALLRQGVISIAYETVQLADGSLPLLTPMSEVAGRMATQIGAHCLEKAHGGSGVLLGGVPGVLPAHVVVLGGGTVGQNAAQIAVGMGARVTVLDLQAQRLRYLDDIYRGRLQTLISNEHNIAEQVQDADLLIGAVLIPGARAPKLVSEQMVETMRPGSVIVDVAIDQGGSIETIDRITTHSNPTYLRSGVLHYAVANMPGAVPRTSTLALTNVTLPYLLRIANLGLKEALRQDPALVKGVNTYEGKLTYEAVGRAHNMETTSIASILGV
ncbi:MAG: alanine dehydrogenase [Thermaerobacter sp.]|nr:alanine dehydrogenase [Thermaerobacter sp.]